MGIFLPFFSLFGGVGWGGGTQGLNKVEEALYIFRISSSKVIPYATVFFKLTETVVQMRHYIFTPIQPGSNIDAYTFPRSS